MDLKRYKQLATIWLALAAAIYAVARFAVRYNEVVDSWGVFFAPGTWGAILSTLATSALVIAPALVAYLAYRGTWSWWLLPFLAASMFVAPSVLAVLAFIAAIIWLLDRSVRVVT